MNARMGLGLLAVLAAGTGGCHAEVRTETEARYYTVYESPPPEPQEEIPERPAGDVLWVAGHWSWTGTRWSWVSGRWLERRPGHVYVSPHWTRRGRGWVFVSGSWRSKSARKSGDAAAAPVSQPLEATARPVAQPLSSGVE